MARVFKRIKGRLYIYDQTSKRINGKVVTTTQYIRPATADDVIRRQSRTDVSSAYQGGEKEEVNLTRKKLTLHERLRMGYADGYQCGFHAGLRMQPKNNKPSIVKGVIRPRYAEEYIIGYDAGYKDGISFGATDNLSTDES